MQVKNNIVYMFSIYTRDMLSSIYVNFIYNIWILYIVMVWISNSAIRTYSDTCLVMQEILSDEIKDKKFLNSL